VGKEGAFKCRLKANARPGPAPDVFVEDDPCDLFQSAMYDADTPADIDRLTGQLHDAMAKAAAGGVGSSSSGVQASMTSQEAGDATAEESVAARGGGRSSSGVHTPSQSTGEATAEESRRQAEDLDSEFAYASKTREELCAEGDAWHARRAQLAREEADPLGTALYGPPYTEGERVKYWSGTLKKWIFGTMLQENGDGTFDLDIKQRARAECVRADHQRRLLPQCANQDCAFLVHSEPEFGDFCCQRCHKSKENGEPIDHGFRCERRTAPAGTARANGRTCRASEDGAPLQLPQRAMTGGERPSRRQRTSSTRHQQEVAAEERAQRVLYYNKYCKLNTDFLLAQEAALTPEERAQRDANDIKREAEDKKAKRRQQGEAQKRHRREAGTDFLLALRQEALGEEAIEQAEPKKRHRHRHKKKPDWPNKAFRGLSREEIEALLRRTDVPEETRADLNEEMEGITAAGTSPMWATPKGADVPLFPGQRPFCLYGYYVEDDGSIRHVPANMPFRETPTALPASSSTAPPVHTMP
jgi:hypothetical protein